MRLSQSLKLFILLLIIIGWLVFLFIKKGEGDGNTITESILSGSTELDETGVVQTGNSVESGEVLQSLPPTGQQKMSDAIQRYDLQHLDVSAVKELFSSVSSMTTQFDTLEIMEHVYKESGDTELLKTMIGLMLQQYRFDQAYNYIKTYESTHYTVVDPHTALNIILNSELANAKNQGSIKKIQDLIEYYRQGALIDENDAKFYKGLVALLSNKPNDFFGLVRQINDSKYNKFKEDVEKSFQKASYRKDLPSYYLNGLLSLDIMGYGYFKIAQQMAIEILLVDDGYDLPYQVLAYTHFVMNNRERAIQYFHVLLEQNDATMQENYKLFLGIAYYWHQDYKDAIIQLTQLSKENKFRTDILRYQLSSYLLLGDVKNSLSVYQLLLSQPDIAFEDFYGYFENVLYKPLVEKTDLVLAQGNEILITQYVTQCFSKLKPEEQYICEYGQAGKFLYENNIAQATEILETLAEKVNKSYIYAALGDYYSRQDRLVQAQEMYTKAVVLAVDERLRQSTEQKLLQMVQPSQNIQ